MEPTPARVTLFLKLFFLGLFFGGCSFRWATSPLALGAFSQTPPPGMTEIIPTNKSGWKVTSSIAPPDRSQPLKVAIFEAKGALRAGLENTEKRIHALPQASLTWVQAADSATADFKQFSVVVFSLGSGSAQGEAVGEAARSNIGEYVRGGGGYVGMGAGAYLACSHFKWARGMLNAMRVSSRWGREAAVRGHRL